MKLEIKKLLELAEFLNKLREIERSVICLDGSKENVMEHTFQLALVCWYINEVEGFGFEVEKILRYALVHDLIEVFSGDTDPYISTKKYIESQPEREKKAFDQIKLKYPEFTELLVSIEVYENSLNDEALFVYRMDKLLPSINTFIADGNYYLKNSISKEKYLGLNRGKIGDSNYVRDLLEKLAEYFTKNKKDFFAQ